MRNVVTLSLALAALVAAVVPARAEAPATVAQTCVNVEYEGSKIWLPGTLTVKKGTKVTLKLINNVPSDPKEHGFAIPAYNIAETVVRGEPKTVEFTADKPGIFPITCHLHPAHVAHRGRAGLSHVRDLDELERNPALSAVGNSRARVARRGRNRPRFMLEC